MTKYCTSSDFGTVDNKTALDPADDAAYKNWGGSWRMPTKAELDELRTKCAWEWKELKGKNGLKVTGPNGNSIFLPAAGRHQGGSIFNAGLGQYWSSSLVTPIGSSHAYDLYFNSQGVGQNSHAARYYGFSVRAVCP